MKPSLDLLYLACALAFFALCEWCRKRLVRTARPVRVAEDPQPAQPRRWEWPDA